MGCGPSNETNTSNMSELELFYFNLPARGEVTRMALRIGGVTHKDTRYEFDAWPAIKSDPKSAPARAFGSLPVIEHDGVVIAQSGATAQYAAELGIYTQGVLGDKPALNRSIDTMVIGAHNDIQTAAFHCLFIGCLLYTSPSPRDRTRSRMPSSA
eukprot:TRINITY_DN16670_c0_g1_i5.p1 TRINITY_DN16670_c0_g1~~TRINITY_DN16670_c0_g1_i5.p1  ORF type:complete len:155 (+),score=34.99 TRINITY_DN16670_c0_g1_i5:98-562(+)